MTDSGINPFDRGYYHSDELREFGFAEVGHNVRISKSCNIVGLQNIRIGNHVRIDFAVTITAGAAGVRIGSYVHIGSYAYLSGGQGIEIGNFANLSQRVSIYTANDDYTGGSFTNPTVPAELCDVSRAPVKIGEHVILGSGSVILPGAVLPEGVSLGTLSFMRAQPVEAWGVYAGIPARKLGMRTEVDPGGHIAADLLSS